jgi:hypothetical protein
VSEHINRWNKLIGENPLPEKQNKNTTQYVLDTTICKQTQATQRRHEPSYKQLEVKTMEQIDW